MREVSLVGRREIPSREAMGPFWNPLRGESLWRLSPFTGVVTLMRLPQGRMRKKIIWVPMIESSKTVLS